jgi:hypothetical protein
MSALPLRPTQEDAPEVLDDDECLGWYAEEIRSLANDEPLDDDKATGLPPLRAEQPPPVEFCADDDDLMRYCA